MTCYIVYTTIHMYSGITSGRVLDGELLYTKILEVNLFAFANANKLTSRILCILYNIYTICNLYTTPSKR